MHSDVSDFTVILRSLFHGRIARGSRTYYQREQSNCHHARLDRLLSRYSLESLGIPAAAVINLRHRRRHHHHQPSPTVRCRCRSSSSSSGGGGGGGGGGDLHATAVRNVAVCSTGLRCRDDAIVRKSVVISCEMGYGRWMEKLESSQSRTFRNYRVKLAPEPQYLAIMSQSNVPTGADRQPTRPSF